MKEKEIKVLKVKPHEHPEVYMLKNTLEAMQEAVGGYIDIVGLDDNVCILLNDEGKLIGLEGNRRIPYHEARAVTARAFLAPNRQDKNPQFNWG